MLVSWASGDDEPIAVSVPRASQTITEEYRNAREHGSAVNRGSCAARGQTEVGTAGAGKERKTCAVLIDMCVNLGLGGLATFRRTLSLVEDGRYEEASEQMLKSLWASQVKTRAVRLAAMMKTGEWPSE